MQADLYAARAQLGLIDARKTAAQADSAAFARWSAERNAAALEVDRQAGLIETHETEAETARRADADAAARREIAAARKAAANLADRIRTDGTRIITELLQLTQDCARQSLAAKALNEALPEGEPPVPVADIVARDFGAEPRKDIRSREVDLWVAETTGAIIGDQNAVASGDGLHGQVHVFGGSMRWKCLKRRFREVEFHPSAAADWPGDLSSLIRLPRLDGPGFVFDGARLIPEAVADLDVAATLAPRKRQPRSTQVELIPIGPWPPAETSPGEAERNVTE
ncbi:hypothetical protein [Bradyrhizobium sp. SSUT77]|uniref:hypothetical protein n=1 Tax=Bradyrhizobium sp. SSUT77 TaxID=3040603 RepID=UPI00244D4A57|nr:hypothetical protein [Bradyrhizobium sp. SSUT77]MDH2341507.1 hypothetical protein [Bradyrhizobium sp. SSUT77]